MANWTRKEIISPAIVAVIGAAVGAGLAVIGFVFSNRTQYLTYHIYPASGLVNKPELGAKKLEVSIDHKPVDNISTVQVVVDNQTGVTGADFEDVPLFIRFAPLGGKAPTIIQPTVQQPDQSQYQVIPASTTAASDGTLTFAYTLKVVNRGGPPAFQATFTFEGMQAPSVKEVSVNRKGVGIKEVKDSASTSGGLEQTVGAIALPILTLIVGFLFARPSIYRSSNSSIDVTPELFTSNRWLLMYNPSTGDSKPVSFETDGTIKLGHNPQEHKWRVYNGKLEIINDKNEVFNRFRFDEARHVFASTNDTGFPTAVYQVLVQVG